MFFVIIFREPYDFCNMLLDELDLKILRKLKENCIRPFVRLAKELGVAEGTIRHRVKRLVGAGIITRFTVDLNAERLGLPVLAFALLSVRGDVQEVASRLSQHDNVLEVHGVHSMGDLLIKVRARSLEELGALIGQAVKGAGAITVNQIIPVFRVWKEGSIVPGWEEKG
ncbi:MAG: transcriptional regulator [Nitrososphaerota archaeon]